MSYETIKQASLTLFAQHGYDGTSLALIAEQVGIKKQSIYSHFNGKDDLFLNVLKETFKVELEREKHFLAQHFNDPLHVCLEESLQSFLDRFHYDDRLKFWLRVTFSPPSHLSEEVNDLLNTYIDHVDLLYLERFEQALTIGEMTETNPERATMAFSALLDSAGVQLVYGDRERVKQKMTAAWTIFWKGITK